MSTLRGGTFRTLRWAVVWLGGGHKACTLNIYGNISWKHPIGRRRRWERNISMNVLRSVARKLLQTTFQQLALFPSSGDYHYLFFILTIVATPVIENETLWILRQHDVRGVSQSATCHNHVVQVTLIMSRQITNLVTWNWVWHHHNVKNKITERLSSRYHNRCSGLEGSALHNPATLSRSVAVGFSSQKQVYPFSERPKQLLCYVFSN